MPNLVARYKWGTPKTIGPGAPPSMAGSIRSGFTKKLLTPVTRPWGRCVVDHVINYASPNVVISQIFFGCCLSYHVGVLGGPKNLAELEPRRLWMGCG